MNGYTSLRRGTGLATRQFATDTPAYGTQLSRRTVGVLLSWMNYIRLQRLSDGYKETLMHTCAPVVCTPEFIPVQNSSVSKCLHLLYVYTVDCVKLVFFFLTVRSICYPHWLFKEYTPLWRDLCTCQAQAPLALCCLIHAQSPAGWELFCHLYVESWFCVPDL